jgi:hypothetical protein
LEERSQDLLALQKDSDLSTSFVNCLEFVAMWKELLDALKGDKDEALFALQQEREVKCDNSAPTI